MVSYHDTMNLSSKHRKILRFIFDDPLRSDVPWSDIEMLFEALGATVSQGKGSRVRVRLHDVRAVFHRPHPERVTDKGALKSVRQFLMTAGISPEENS
jgi:hypothetical protein